MRDPLTFEYSFRHLSQRKVQTVMTLCGIALVVFVFVATLMLAQGLKTTMVSTGSQSNVLVIMTGSQNEIESGISREAAAVIQNQPEVAQLENGRRVATADLVVLVALKKRSNKQISNVTVRGVSATSSSLRADVKLTQGRMFQEGTQEIIVGRAVNKKFEGTDIGQQIRLVGTFWKVVGIFDAGPNAFSSEIWGDVNILMPAFRRDQFSSVTFQLAAGANYDSLKQRLENDPRLSVSIQREREFYEAQSKDLAAFIRYLGGFVSVVFSLGAIIGAMITMHGAVVNRVREIGILRAIGFSRIMIFSTFLKECLLIGFFGGILGIALASGLSFVTFATTNFSNFADVAFGFKLTLEIVFWGLMFALIMGVVGGAVPAFGASRMQIVNTLRAE